ncbi:CLIP domain-containing serine protease 14D-like [Pollicipes pollicipes]|uniref:CLIP domain-containing serine protease 14D-like n=1 Tax=Pollicipes pollicipes TaxID=41117 RepID=UPI0018851556|nr:CLIP domain-containing serine protease 14D-like [Pollicipes pollicipes]
MALCCQGAIFAHCVRSHTAGELVLRLGEYNLSSTTDGHHQDFAVLRSIAHPNSRRRQNDLALLRLDGTVTFSRLMQPICLPEADKTTDGNGDYLLCEATYRQLPSFDDSFPDGGFNGTKLCAADPEQAGADACLGDSGGPLTVFRSDGWYELSGLVSFGVGCGDPDFPGVYTRVSSYVDWVVDMIASEKGPHTSDHAHV